MSLSGFIRNEREAIVREFAVFARTLMPPERAMTEAELRDHAEELLTALVHDMSLAQSSQEQLDKSQGRGAARSMRASGRLHADDRIQHGFAFEAVIAEFRALRLIRFGGHLPKEEYDGHHDGAEGSPDPAELH